MSSIDELAGVYGVRTEPETAREELARLRRNLDDLARAARAVLDEWGKPLPDDMVTPARNLRAILARLAGEVEWK